VLAAGLAGCGGGAKKPAGAGEGIRGAPTVPVTTPQTAPVTPAPPATATAPAQPAPTTTAPQASPGAGGGSEPARTELTFTVAGTRITPQRAGVAPFISVRVTLMARDKAMHALTIGGKTLTVGPGRPSATATLAGLKPGQSYAGHTSRGQTVRILSTSEPGP
jgi:hypothetical protein